MASVLQVLGLIAVIVGVFMLSVPIGVITAGVIVTGVGYLLEPSMSRGKDNR